MIRHSLGNWVLDSNYLWAVSPLVPANVDVCLLSFSSYAMDASLNALLTSRLTIQCANFAFTFWAKLLKSLTFTTEIILVPLMHLTFWRKALVNWMLKAKREALSWFYACFKEVSYIVTMLRKSKNDLPKNMLTVMKIRLEQGTAELVEPDLTSCQEGDLSLGNMGNCQAGWWWSGSVFINSRFKFTSMKTDLRKTLRQSILSNNCKLLLLQFVNSFYLRHLSK